MSDVKRLLAEMLGCKMPDSPDDCDHKYQAQRAIEIVRLPDYEAAVEALAAMAEAVDAGKGELGHRYYGTCPDPLQPESRDPDCLACTFSDRASAALAPFREKAIG